MNNNPPEGCYNSLITRTMYQKKLKIALLMILIVTLGSASHISLPLVVSEYPSIYFVLFLCSVESIIIYGSILIGIRFYHHINSGLFEEHDDWATFKQYWKIIIATGISNAVMSILMMYSANPVRTPVVIQSVFLGLAILSSIFFSKILLNKTVKYNWGFAITSILFLLGSVGIAIVPLTTGTKMEDLAIMWSIMFMFGVFSFSLTNVLQEKFIRDTRDDSFDNKIYLAFYSSLFQFTTIILFSWLDLFIGYPIDMNNSTSTFELFVDGFTTMADPINLFLIQLFIVLWCLLFVLALFLNEISTNYTMILTNITNQSVALFFIIFPHLNHGIKYPLYITLCSLGASFISIILWVNAEDTSTEEENYPLTP